MATVPMIGPDGSVADVPQQSVASAVQQGAKIGFDMISPDGKERAVVPADQVHAAIAQGAQLDPASAARFAGASVPKPANPILQDDANQPRYSDIIGPNGGPGAPGEAENANGVSITELGKGVAKAAASDTLALGQAVTPNVMVSPRNRQIAKDAQAKLQPSNLEQQVGADTERAATSLAPVAVAGSAAMVPSATVGVPELLENIAGIIRGAKSAAPDVASIAANGPSKAEAGEAALDAAARVKSEAGQAVGAAKDAAIPPDFKMTINPDGPLFKTLGEIDDQIGPKAGGLQSLKDPSLDVVRNVSEELSNKGPMDQNDVEAIRQQLNSQITRADAAAKSGTATGDPARYLKQIKSAFDQEYYDNLSAATNSENAANLQNASRGYAETIANQQRGPAKAIFNAPTPEGAIRRLTAPSVDASTVASFTKGMNADELNSLRNGVLKSMADSVSDADGNVKWQSLQDKFLARRDAMKQLFGKQFDAVAGQIQDRAAAEAKAAGRTRFAKALARHVAYDVAGAGIVIPAYEIFHHLYKGGE